MFQSNWFNYYTGNLLYGKYFHDSNLNIQITDAMFNLQYVAASLGVDVNQGGVTLYESAKAGETVAAGGKITLTNTAVAFDGAILAWYKKPADDDWTVASVSQNEITVPGATVGDHYCVKYFYQHLNAKRAIMEILAIKHISLTATNFLSGNSGIERSVR